MQSPQSESTPMRLTFSSPQQEKKKYKHEADCLFANYSHNYSTKSSNSAHSA